MIERIIDWSARNGFLVGLATLFLMGWGIWAVLHTPLDALPDLSDVQVIVFTEWPGRSPDLVEDQITYPIVTSMLGKHNHLLDSESKLMASTNMMGALGMGGIKMEQAEMGKMEMPGMETEMNADD